MRLRRRRSAMASALLQILGFTAAPALHQSFPVVGGRDRQAAIRLPLMKRALHRPSTFSRSTGCEIVGYLLGNHFFRRSFCCALASRFDSSHLNTSSSGHATVNSLRRIGAGNIPRLTHRFSVTRFVKRPRSTRSLYLSHIFGFTVCIFILNNLFKCSGKK